MDDRRTGGIPAERCRRFALRARGIDVKGELFAVTRRHRRSPRQRVVILNPLGKVEPSIDRFNPLDYVRRDPEHVTADAEVIAKVS